MYINNEFNHLIMVYNSNNIKIMDMTSSDDLHIENINEQDSFINKIFWINGEFLMIIDT